LSCFLDTIAIFPNFRLNILVSYLQFFNTVFCILGSPLLFNIYITSRTFQKLFNKFVSKTGFYATSIVSLFGYNFSKSTVDFIIMNFIIRKWWKYTRLISKIGSRLPSVRIFFFHSWVEQLSSNKRAKLWLMESV